jgi:putative acetyltransferase
MNLQIVTYDPMYAQHFRDLNLAWITKYFTVEPEDRKMLDHPQEMIIDKGGHILFALAGAVVAGTCALIKNGAWYELAKMATREDFQGKGIGYLMGMEAIRLARKNNAEKIILDTNSSLKPALHLYEKLGFQYAIITEEQKARYNRADVMMELLL